MTDYLTSDTDLTAIANAIRTKGGTSSPLEFPNGFVSAVQAIPSGGSSVPSNDVNFLDYDGTIVASYSAADFANLTELPANPTHQGLTAQGWNWTLADAKTYVAAYGMLDIGQMYVTDDGKTRLYITIPDNAPDNARTLYLSLYTSGDAPPVAYVDFGDGSELVETYWYDELQHTYAQSGSYIITIDGGEKLSISFNNRVLSQTSQVNLSAWLRHVELGKNFSSIRQYNFQDCVALESITIPMGLVSIDSFAFYECVNLKHITLPTGLTTLSLPVTFNFSNIKSVSFPKGSYYTTSAGTGYFRDCRSLKRACLPDGVSGVTTACFENCYSMSSVVIPVGTTAIMNHAFSKCYALQSVTIPSSVTSIGDNAFNLCYALQSVTIPSSVTTIGSQAFAKCGLRAIHFKPTTPPTVATSSAWSDLQTSCKIYVPTGHLSDYTGAQNYPSSATYTYVEE